MNEVAGAVTKYSRQRQQNVVLVRFILRNDSEIGPQQLHRFQVLAGVEIGQLFNRHSEADRRGRRGAIVEENIAGAFGIAAKREEERQGVAGLRKQLGNVASRRKFVSGGDLKRETVRHDATKVVQLEQSSAQFILINFEAEKAKAELPERTSKKVNGFLEKSGLRLEVMGCEIHALGPDQLMESRRQPVYHNPQAVVSIERKRGQSSMKIDGSYDFSELTQIEGIFVSNGREKATGRLVQVHLFPAAKAADANRVCERMFSLPDEARDKILKYGQEGSASYFITEPLPEGEHLQSWVERLCTVPRPASVPEVSLGLTGQLRQMGIAPAALAPIMPGPEQPARAPAGGGGGAKSEPGEFTRVYKLGLIPKPPANEPAIQKPASTSSDGFTGTYGRDELADAGLPPIELAPEPIARPAAAGNPTGLETFIGLRPAAVPAAAPPTPAPAPPAAAPSVFEPEPPPASVAIEQPSRMSQEPLFEPFPAVSPVPPAPAAPMAQPVPVAAARERVAARPSSPSLDWKVVLATAAILIVAAVILMAVLERSA